MKRRYMYTIPRAVFFNMPRNLRLHVIRTGSLWVEIMLNEDEVFILWTQGIVATPVTPG